MSLRYSNNIKKIITYCDLKLYKNYIVKYVYAFFVYDLSSITLIFIPIVFIYYTIRKRNEKEREKERD